MLAVNMVGKRGSDYNDQVAETLRRIAFIEDRMRAFMAAHGRLPRPANSSYKIGSEYFGVEAVPSANLDPNDLPKAYIGPDIVTGQILRGDVPLIALGIDDPRMGQDAFGNRLVYQVQEDATDVSSCALLQQAVMKQAVTQQPDRALIRIRDQSGGIKDHVFWAILSQGPDGLNNLGVPADGVMVEGRRNTGFGDADTLINGVPDPAQFRDVLVDKPKTATFDDIVYYPNNYYKHVCCLKHECLAEPSPQTGFRFTGENGADLAGKVIARADVNGDGLEDLIVGAPDKKAVYVVFGTLLGYPDPLPLASLDGSNGFKIDGSTIIGGGLFGWAIAAADLDGDGVDDMIISDLRSVIEWFSCPSPVGNAVYVIFGRPAPATWPPVVTFTSLGGVWNPANVRGVAIGGNALPKGFGYSLAAGDFNGDGIKDAAIGSLSTDVKVIYGSSKKEDWPVAPNLVNVNMLAGVRGFRITPDANSSHDPSRPDYPTGTQNFAAALAAGPVNDNSDTNPKDALAIGAPKTTYSASRAGSAYVVFGSAAFPGEFKVESLNGGNGFRVDGHTPQANAGMSLAVGDMDGDGFAEIAIGAPGIDAKLALASSGILKDTGQNGVTYVIRGGTGWSARFDTSTLDGTNGFVLIGSVPNDYFGASLAMGDVDKDGTADLIVGAPRDNPGGVNDAGAAYIVFGKPDGFVLGDFTSPKMASAIDGVSISRMRGSLVGQRLGWSVGAVGLKGLIFKDVVASSPFANFGEGANQGGGYVWFGNEVMVPDLDAENMP